MTGPGYRDTARLSRVVVGAFLAYAVLAVVAIWSDAREIALLESMRAGNFATEAEAASNDQRQSVIGVLQVATSIAAGVLFLRFVYLSAHNARLFGPHPPRFTPGWAVGWYFIPVAFLWKPYQALYEIFRRSDPERTEGTPDGERPSILPVWWTLWIISQVLGRLLVRQLNATSIEDFIRNSWTFLISDGLDIPLSLAAATVVSTLQRWQQESNAKLSARTRSFPDTESAPPDTVD